MGDFKSICFAAERLGERGASNSFGVMVACFFSSNFIFKKKLVDLSLLCRKFTWFHANGGAASRLYKILMSYGWWDFLLGWYLNGLSLDMCLVIVLSFSSILIKSGGRNLLNLTIMDYIIVIFLIFLKLFFFVGLILLLKVRNRLFCWNFLNLLS